MTGFQHGRQTRVYVNGFDVSMYLRSVSSPVSVEPTETTTLVNEFKTYIPGMADATIGVEGLWEGSAEGFQALIEDSIQDGQPSIWLVTHGRTAGSSCYGMAAEETSVALETSATELVTFNVEGQSSSFRENGVILKALGEETGAAVSPAHDYGRRVENGAVYMQALAPGDGASPVLCEAVAQHSVDGVTWVDLEGESGGGFVISETGKLAARIDIRDGINRYTRASWSAGGGTSVPFIIAITRRPD
jgi:hypothetical protein